MTLPGVLLLLVVSQPTSAEVVERAFARQEETTARFGEAAYTGDYVYHELDAEGRVLREETCRRRVLVRNGHQHNEFLSVAANGQELSGPARARQIAAMLKKGLVQDQTQMPLRLDSRTAYDYELLGQDTCSGCSAWVVGFVPRKRSMQTVIGRAFVDCDNYDVLRLEFRPARLPWACAGTTMILDFADFGGFTLPSRFEMDMEIRVKFIITFARRWIHIDDRYSDYEFGMPLPDSLPD